MLTQELLAVAALAGALLLGSQADAEAHGWRGPRFHPAPVVRVPVYRVPVYRAPLYAPVYRTPVYQTPVYRAPVYQTPVNRPVYAPAHRSIGWHHHSWGHPIGSRW